MKFTFTAALFAIASGAAADASSVSQSSQMPPPKVQSSALYKGALRGNPGFERILVNSGDFPVPYYDNGCLPDNFKDKCGSCLCLEGGEGNAVQPKRCDINANPDGNRCVDKAAKGTQCSYNWECQSNSCLKARNWSQSYYCQ